MKTLKHTIEQFANESLSLNEMYKLIGGGTDKPNDLLIDPDEG